MRHFVIGTAGHVDHGKTVLVKALTGVDTDRLKEEKARGISIELGFAPFRLPGGTLAAIVDVPGHERFIKNMLAGVGGIDLVLLVIAADEGIMPQTREHLDIIDLLQIPQGIIVITKIDLVDEEWLELVKEEAGELVRGTVLEKAPVMEVSAVTGQGIKELAALIEEVARNLESRPVSGFARMPVDRVFTITGFGTVVTGTLLAGSLQVGDTVEVLPGGASARIRGLQVHGQKVERAEAGQRVAANLAGVEHEEIERGNVIALPGMLKPSHRLDIRIKLLPNAPKALVNRARVRVHIGTAEILARVILLESDEMEPGGSAFAQLECEEPMVAARGDRLVIRSYSPMRTIAGGKVIDPLPPKRKRLNSATIEDLKTREKGTPEELLEQFMVSSKHLAVGEEELVKSLGMDDNAVRGAIDKLLAAGTVRKIAADSKPQYILSSKFSQKGEELSADLENYHRKFPLRFGVSKEEIRSRYFPGLSSKQFNALLDLYRAEGVIDIVGENIARHGHTPAPDAAQAKMFGEIEELFMKGEFQPPGWDDISGRFKLNPAESEEILNYFINNRTLVKLEDNILIHRRNLERAKEMIVGFLSEKGEMTLAEARDLLKTSRKFALPIMNYLDQERVTRRVEDKRVLY